MIIYVGEVVFLEFFVIFIDIVFVYVIIDWVFIVFIFVVIYKINNSFII